MPDIESQVSLDSVELRRAFTLYPRGVMAVAAEVGGKTSGLAVSAFVSLSLDPALMIICIDKTSTTWPIISQAERIGVSVICEEDAWLGRQLGARGVDRFSGVDLRKSSGGALLLENAVATFTTSIFQELPGGDHTIVVLAVHDYELNPDRAPLVWYDTSFVGVRSLDS